MGTTYNISTVFESPQDDAKLKSIANGVSDVLKRVDKSMSTYKSESEVTRFSRLKVGEELTIGSDLNSVIRLSQEISKFSGGYFDITVGPLVALWGFGVNGVDKEGIPKQAAIDLALSKVGMDKFSLEGQMLKKLNEVELDLSAIAKGFSADNVGRYLDGIGVTNYMVEVGGEVVVKGVNRRGSNWVLGIEKPDKNQRSVYTAVGISGVGMATSGDYRNFRTLKGENYAHTIDPVKGEPVKSRLASVTVISSTCAEADALATALMAMGDELAIEFANEHQLRAFFIVRHNDMFESLSTPLFEKYVL